MRRLITMSLLLLVCVGSAQADLILPHFETNVEIYRLFGEEHPGPYKHPASITQLKNGDYYVAYYGGENEYSAETAVYGSRCKQGKKKWSAPKIIAKTPFQGVGNPVVWQAPDGVVWLFYNNQYGDTWSNARVKAKISLDGAKSWSDSFMLCMEEGSMVRGQPIVLDTGEYLLPLYNEKGDDREFTDSSSVSYFLRYNPKTQEWTESKNRIRSPEGNLQAQVVQISATDLFCFMRRGGGYGPTEDGWMLRSDSKDGGFSWTDAVRTDFPNPNSAVELIKLKNGHLLLVYNDSMSDRTPLTLAVSTDNGETWPFRRMIAGGDNDFAYPYAIQGSDDKIYLIYTTNSRTSIMLAVFDERAVTEYEP
ncbi:MAG: hypothetical protein BWY07_01491 [Candidatus Hydrogenedentes bacterium ADurb.Bin170]|jgi:predicted neuraminidase|nr:MAG: hypothetical protein BWY07_01491 [Candidatus Hydrogenedentes bacterium ADurb.Bin170]